MPIDTASTPGSSPIFWVTGAVKRMVLLGCETDALHGHIDRQHLLHVVAGVHAPQSDQRRQQRRRARKQHERERDLRRREDLQAAIGGGRDANAARRQAISGGRLRRWKARHVGQEHGRGHRERGADPEQAGIDGDFERPHGESCRKARHDRDHGPCEQDAEDRARSTKHQALRQQRASQRTPAGAECCADGELAFTANRARQDQVGDIRAGDDEDHRRRQRAAPAGSAAPARRSDRAAPPRRSACPRAPDTTPDVRS